MSLKIKVATPQEATGIWVQLQAQMRKALSRAAGDSWSEAQLFGHLLLGGGKMLVAHDGDELLGCLIIEFLERDKGRCLYVLAVAGIDHKRWSGEMNEVLRNLAREAGCYCVEAYCADGTERVIRNYGWTRKAVLMEMAICPAAEAHQNQAGT